MSVIFVQNINTKISRITAMAVLINMIRIGATAKIIAKAIVAGKATTASFIQLSIIPDAPAKPPTHAIINKRKGVIPKRLDSDSFMNFEMEAKIEFVHTWMIVSILFSVLVPSLWKEIPWFVLMKVFMGIYF